MIIPVEILILVLLVYHSIITRCQADNPKIPAELLAKALNHIIQTKEPNTEHIIESLRFGDIETLYQVARSMNDAGDTQTSVEIWHALADGDASHIMSMVSLGFTYSVADKQQALKYFVQAGEDGPHQSSLYNAGLIFIETNDYPSGMAYIRAAATFEGEGGSDKMSQMAVNAYQKLSSMMKSVKMSLQNISDTFPCANIDGFPKEGSAEYKLWDNAMRNLEDYNKSQNPKHMIAARKDLSKLQNQKGISDLQGHFLDLLLARTKDIIEGEL